MVAYKSRSFWRYYVFVIATLVLVSSVGLSQQVYDSKNASERLTAKSPADIVAAAEKAVVVVKAQDSERQISTGSGFLVDASGIVVTNFHVVQDAQRVDIKLQNGDSYEVMAVPATDRPKDIAILRIAGFELPTLSMGNSGDVRVGDRVVVIGNALGTLEGTVTSGVLSGIRESEGYKLFQMDAAVSKGNSGGPVLNQEGEVIGVTVAKIEAGESLNFAIPINYVRGLLQIEATSAGLTALKSDQSQQSLFVAPPEVFPKRWKSLVSGSVKLIRIDGERIYVETELPRTATEAGNFALAELSKEGESWRGTSRNRTQCWSGSKWKWCYKELPIEISLLTSQRIEGSVIGPPDDADFDCGRCKWSKPDAKLTFVWIPE